PMGVDPVPVPAGRRSAAVPGRCTFGLAGVIWRSAGGWVLAVASRPRGSSTRAGTDCVGLLGRGAGAVGGALEAVVGDAAYVVGGVDAASERAAPVGARATMATGCGALRAGADGASDTAATGWL